MNRPISELNYLNLGCGRRFHPKWTNLDFVSGSPFVRAHNLLEGVPYPEETFDVVYHSHLLEHFSREAAPIFLRECYRVLRPSGILRIAVPDLEDIVRHYLNALDSARQGKEGSGANYDWMLLELYDQTVRGRSGGGWRAYLSQEAIPNWEFVEKRGGAEARELRASHRCGANGEGSSKVSLRARVHFILKNLPAIVRNKLLDAFLSKGEYEALQLGRFRRSGEIHEWMYDSYSLARLLRSLGFPEPRKVAATQSEIPDWTSYCLDNEPDGSTYKPDSLFMEARKLPVT
jgi:SAM-dependent methyltransferase